MIIYWLQLRWFFRHSAHYACKIRLVSLKNDWTGNRNNKM